MIAKILTRNGKPYKYMIGDIDRPTLLLQFVDSETHTTVTRKATYMELPLLELQLDNLLNSYSVPVDV